MSPDPGTAMRHHVEHHTSLVATLREIQALMEREEVVSEPVARQQAVGAQPAGVGEDVGVVAHDQHLVGGPRAQLDRGRDDIDPVGHLAQVEVGHDPADGHED